MKIYEIKKAMDEIIDEMCIQAQENEGVYQDYLDRNLEDLSISLDEKRENWLLWIKNKIALAEAIKYEEKKLKERCASLEKAIENSKIFYTKIFGAEKFQTAKCSLSFRKSEFLDIFDETLLPKEFLVEKITYAPDKICIKKAIKAGDMVPGANIREKLNMQIK